MLYLNSSISNPVGASAQVGTTSSGSMRSILVTNPSNGYQLSPNSSISFTGGGGSGSAAEINLLDTSKLSQVSFIVGNTGSTTQFDLTPYRLQLAPGQTLSIACLSTATINKCAISLVWSTQ